MRGIIEWVRSWNHTVRKLTIVDLKLVQVASMAFVLILAKLFPAILGLGLGWLIAFALACSARAIYLFWFDSGPWSQADPEKLSKLNDELQQARVEQEEHIAELVLTQAEQNERIDALTMQLRGLAADPPESVEAETATVTRRDA